MTEEHRAPPNAGNAKERFPSSSGRRKGWRLVVIGIGFAITFLLTVGVVIQVILNTKGFE